MKKSRFIIYLGILLLMFCGSFGAGYYYNLKVSSKPVMAKKNSIPKEFENASKEPLKQSEEQSKEQPKEEVPKVVDGPITQKEIFLTIDDGPSTNNTPKIIDILNKNGVKATFFIIGKKAEENPNMVKKLDENGMCIVNHSYSHDYKMYKSIETCMQDFDKCSQVLKRITGKDAVPFIRFPGGSDNRVSNLQTMKSIREAMKTKGIYYVDWNVSSADAAPGFVSSDQIRNNLITQSSQRKLVVSLMHDSADKKTTAEALPEVIKSLKEQGFVFRTFKDITPTELKELIKLRVIYR